MVRRTVREDAGGAQGGESVPEVDPRFASAATVADESVSQVAVQRAKGLVKNTSEANKAALQTFIDWLAERANTTDEDQFEIMAQITAEILTAPDMASLMSEATTLHARDVIGVPMLMHGFEIREGTFESGPFPFYAAITCSRPDAERSRIVTCGAAKVLAKLKRMEELITDENTGDEWPQVFWFTEKQVANGNTVLDIVRA